MAFLNDTVGSLIDDITGSNSGPTLQDFLLKFGSTEGKYVDTLDPLATFDTYMELYPPFPGIAKSQSGFNLDSALESLGGVATSALKNLGNNLTGGLLGSLMNQESVMSKHNSSYSKLKTFIQYLAEANLLVGGENWFSSKLSNNPLQILLGMYVQSITVPRIKMIDGNAVVTQIGLFNSNGAFVIPDNNLLMMDILCTKLPLHERLFYPWMKEVTLPFWSYNDCPYTTATITIDFSKHNDLQYVFTGCRPQQIDMILPTLTSDSDITRQVTFLFDFMFITSNKLPVIESWSEKLIGTGKTLLNGAGNMINL